MAAAKSLSDEELRQKLLEHGISSPVTATTRSTLVRRLNHAIAAAKKHDMRRSKARRGAITPTSRLNTFSSDEDDESGSAVRSTRRTRTSTDRHYDRRNGSSGGGLITPRVTDHRGTPMHTPSDLSIEASSTSSSRYKLHVPAASVRPGLSKSLDYDTGSDSDPAENEDAVDSSRGMSRLWGCVADEPQVNNSSSRVARLQNHTDRSFSARDDSTRNRKARSYLENGRECRERGDGDAATTTAGYLSVADSIVTHASPTGPEHTRVANGRHHTEPGPEVEHAESTWHYNVPLLLLVLLAAFFGSVAVLYVNMRMPLLPTLRSVPAVVHKAMANLPVPSFTHSGVETGGGGGGGGGGPSPAPPDTRPPPAPTQAPARRGENRFPVCSGTLKSNCLSIQDMAVVQPVLGLLEGVVVPALQHQAGRYQCGDSPDNHLTLPHLQNLVHQHLHYQEPSDCLGALQSLGRLVEWNPHWGLQAVREGDGTLVGLALSSQPTYILCHITTAIYSTLYLIMAIVTVIITAWLAFSCVRYYRWKAEEEKQQVYELVEQILEVLGGLGGASGKDFVAVNHVRDSLISPRDRRTKQALWDKAVHFINTNESRVRREIQPVGGEDCEVWRWASGVPHSPGTSPGVDGGGGWPPPKVWQGPAFNTLSPHNVPNLSPTSCLKIRNMFDCDVEFGESWPSRIQDSILEKCEGISIVHVAVDRRSREGCVYLKCASLTDSGRAFRALHGWWYDGNLVTVKFLRDERYHQRFPSARDATHRLRPSNNKRLSLQAATGQAEPPSHT